MAALMVLRRRIGTTVELPMTLLASFVRTTSACPAMPTVMITSPYAGLSECAPTPASLLLLLTGISVSCA